MPPDHCQEHSGLVESVENLCAKVDRICDKVDKGDDRTRRLEQWQGRIIGGLAMLGFLMAAMMVPIVSAFIG